ncbi:deoxycytidyl transferase [Microbotryomycetes sp. JL221]|nr:deoxycytidyl transferase [Microbotryomycetes sp. JL221]
MTGHVARHDDGQDEYDSILNSEQGFDQAVDQHFDDDDDDDERLHSTSSHHHRLETDHHNNQPVDSDEEYYNANDGTFDVTGFGEGGKYLANKRKKLTKQIHALIRHEQRDSGHQPDQIFAGLAIYVNGLTPIPLNSLYKMMAQRGAQIVQYLDRKQMVTHILAQQLTPSKMIEFQRYKVVNPQWILDSVQQNKLLDWRKYSTLSAVATGDPLPFDDVAARRGAPTTTHNLLTMLGTHQNQQVLSKTTSTTSSSTATTASTSTTHPQASSSPRKRKIVPISTTTTTATTTGRKVETAETLAERGVRLAQAVLSAQQQQHKPDAPNNDGLATIFKTRTATTAPDQLDQQGPIKPTTDFAGPSTDQTRSYLPLKSKSIRTKQLLDDPDWMSRHTSASEDFLTVYFKQSRLHHISTWKEELKQLVANMQTTTHQQQISSLRNRQWTGTERDDRIVFHVDFDCFFVSAGLTTRPHLKGQPVAVCHAKNSSDQVSSTSEIASCSYEARAKGVKAGISLGRAQELCPDIVTIPFEFDLYRNIASQFYSILLKHAIVLQAVSVDEVLMEVKVPSIDNNSSQDAVLDYAQQIRKEIRQTTNCEASIGISHNILLARLASRHAKPANAFRLLPHQVKEFLMPLSVDALPGIGWQLRTKLQQELEIKTVQDLLNCSQHELQKCLGEQNSKKFKSFSKGIDDRPLQILNERKSISTEVNYGIRFRNQDPERVESFMFELAQETSRRLKNEQCLAKQLTLKVMQRHPDAPKETPKFLGHGWCQTINQSASIAGPGGKATDDGQLMGQVVNKLLKKLNIEPEELRGLAIQLSKLERKDVKSIDNAMEKGQSTLSFGLKTLTKEKSQDDSEDDHNDTKQLDPPRRGSKRLRQEPSVLVLSDSDSSNTDIAPPPAKKGPLTRASTRRLATVEVLEDPQTTESKRSESPYVPSMFKRRPKAGPAPPPPISQITDAELIHYGLDVEWFRALPREVQTIQFEEARKTRFAPISIKSNNGQIRLQGQVSKTNLIVESKQDFKGKGKSLNKQISVIEIPSSSSPSPQVVETSNDDTIKTTRFVALPGTLTNDELELLGFDSTIYKELPIDEQRQIAKDNSLILRSLKEKRDLNQARLRKIDKQTTTRFNSTLKKVKLVKPLRFSQQSTEEKQFNVVENWLNVNKTLIPTEKDWNKFACFLENLILNQSKGRDVDRALRLLDWWKYLIQTEVDVVEQSDVSKGWWEAWSRTKDRLANAIERTCGATVEI